VVVYISLPLTKRLKPERKSRLEDPDVDGRIILRWIYRKGCGDVELIELAQDRDRWRAVVNAVMNLRVP